MVEATSSKGGEAVLTLKDYGVMTYISSGDIYRIVVDNTDYTYWVTVNSSLGGVDNEQVKKQGGSGGGGGKGKNR